MKSIHARLRWFNHHHPRLAWAGQVGVIVLLCLAGDWLVQVLRWPVPGSIVALAVVLFLLAARLIPAAGLQRGADWLLAEMLLFFIPAVMAVSQHMALLRTAGLRIVAVILIGTVLVMSLTALLVDVVFRWEQRRAR